MLFKWGNMASDLHRRRNKGEERVRTKYQKMHGRQQQRYQQNSLFSPFFLTHLSIIWLHLGPPLNQVWGDIVTCQDDTRSGESLTRRHGCLCCSWKLATSVAVTSLQPKTSGLLRSFHRRYYTYSTVER